MFLENILSSKVVAAPLIGGRSYPITPTLDFEDGGIALSDTSEGLMYQVWKTTLVNYQNVYVEADNYPRELIYSGIDSVSEISCTFDQNMNTALAFVERGAAYLRWYDTAVGDYVVTSLEKDVVNPRVFLDDKRILQRPNSDIILGYIKRKNLYFRMQRDRFLVEYLLAENISSLHTIGMNRKLRLQFMIRT